MNALNLSENIMRLRHERKITQEELADFVGVTKAAVSNFYCGISERHFDSGGDKRSVKEKDSGGEDSGAVCYWLFGIWILSVICFDRKRL